MIAAAMWANPNAFAQIIHDGSLGPRLTLVGPNYLISSQNGILRGNNLFQSFSQFNLLRAESATFVGGSGIANIIARITGGQPSSIDGRVQTNYPNTSLFLLNPSGILFGPNASINVGGSFYASTADYLRFSDNTLFTVDVAPNVTLSMAAPAAFGFTSPTAASIQVNGSQLTASAGQTIGLISGDMRFVRNGTSPVLDAKGGRILLAAVRGTGEAKFASAGEIDTGSFSRMGDITMRDGTIIRVREGPARTGSGSVYVRAGNFVLDHSSIDASTAAGNGGLIDISARETLALSAGKLTALTTGAGNAGGISLSGTDINFGPGSSADTSCNPGCTTGRGGDIAIAATNNFTLFGDSTGGQSFIVSNSFGSGNAGILDFRAGSFNFSGIAFIQAVSRVSGTAGNITVRANDIRILNGAAMDVSTRGSGNGGVLRLDGLRSVIIDGARINPANLNLMLPSALVANADGSGNAGSILITTADLSVTGGARISSRTASTGRGGNIVLRASNRISIAGQDSLSGSTAVLANTLGEGDAGSIEIDTPSLQVTDYAVIQSQSEGRGKGNRILIRGGNVTVSARGQISSDARSLGAGGAIEIDISGALTISGPNTGLFAKTYGPAAGGEISIRAGTLVLTGLGGITVTTDGTGNAGKIDISQLGSLDISSGARITSESTAQGLAGDILIIADSMSIAENSGIRTSANFADGGNISISASDRIVVSGGQITTAVGNGSGNGGNIRINVPLMLLREKGVVSANAFGGDGGNIDATVKTLMRAGDSQITASSRFGLDGTILLSSPAIDLTRDLVALETNYLDAGAILAGRCSTRFAGRASTLAIFANRRAASPPSGLFLGVPNKGLVKIARIEDLISNATADKAQNGMCATPIETAQKQLPTAQIARMVPR